MDASQKADLLQQMGVDVYTLRHTAVDEIDNIAEADSKGLDVLAREVADCKRCNLYKSRTQTVFGVGHPQAQIMFVAEAPGQDEDLQGEPFVGRAGQLLNLMLGAAGWRREEVYIANILKCRPPNNRNPQADEIGQCEDYLVKQIALIKPQLLVALGRIAAQNLLSTSTSISRLRGQKHIYQKAGIPLIVSYHPAYLLRNPIDKAKAWEDLLFIKSTLV